MEVLLILVFSWAVILAAPWLFDSVYHCFFPRTPTLPDAAPTPPVPMRSTPPPPAGYVYLLSNPAMPGLVKIGQTTRTVKERVAELSAHTGVAAPFVIEAAFASHNPMADEARVHAHLAA
jgi:hypothetical protein